jgi:hypothetical protein
MTGTTTSTTMTDEYGDARRVRRASHGEGSDT